jgi:hypothetical protein
VMAVLVKGIVSPGRHTIIWKANGIPSGLYLVRLQTAGQTAFKTLLVTI